MLTNGIISDPCWSRGSNIEQVVHEKHNDSDFPLAAFTFEFLWPQKNVTGSGKYHTAYKEIMTAIVIDYSIISFIFLNNVRRYHTSMEPLA